MLNNTFRFFLAFMALMIYQSVVGQNHYVILIDGAGKARNELNKESLTNILSDSIPQLLFEKGISIKKKIIKADNTDFFSICYYGLVSNKKYRHFGGNEMKYLNVLKKVNLNKDYIHPIKLQEKGISKKQLERLLTQSITQQPYYHFGYPSMAEYLFIKKIENTSININNTVILLIVSDILFNGNDLSDERGSGLTPH